MSFWMKIWNGFNLAVLPSHFHWMTSKTTLLITLKGRKSGREITLPVNYIQQGTTIRITSKPGRLWWRNLKTNPDVKINLRGNEVPGKAQVFQAQEDVARELSAFLQPQKNMAKYYQIRLNKDGTFNQEDLMQSAQRLVLIRVEVPASTGR